MSSIVDLPAVREFTGKLNKQLRECESGEGMICSTLQDRIDHCLKLWRQLTDYVFEWSDEVFAAKTPYDKRVESLLLAHLRELVRRSKRLAAHARFLDGDCYGMERYDTLNWFIVRFDYVVENWTSPRPSVGPGPRSRIAPELGRSITERAAKLAPLPNDWQPTTPDEMEILSELKQYELKKG